jgi:hypothetical protein
MTLKRHSVIVGPMAQWPRARMTLAVESVRNGSAVCAEPLPHLLDRLYHAESHLIPAALIRLLADFDLTTVVWST